MAANQDTVTMQRFNDQKGELDILTKSKQELLSMMPQSASAADVAAAPVSV